MGRAKLVKLLGSYGPAFISDSGLLAGPGGATLAITLTLTLTLSLSQTNPNLGPDP